MGGQITCRNQIDGEETPLSYTQLLFVRLELRALAQPRPLHSSQPLPLATHAHTNTQLYNVALMGTSMMSLFFEHQAVAVNTVTVGGVTTTTAVQTALTPSSYAPEIIGQFIMAMAFFLMGIFWVCAFWGDVWKVKHNFEYADLLQHTLSRDGKATGKAAEGAEQLFVWLPRFLSIYSNVLVSFVSGPIMLYCAYTWIQHLFHVPPAPPALADWRDLVFIKWDSVAEADVSCFEGAPPFLPLFLGASTHLALLPLLPLLLNRSSVLTSWPFASLPRSAPPCFFPGRGMTGTPWAGGSRAAMSSTTRCLQCHTRSFCV